MTVSYQAYLDTHLPADIPQTRYDPVYMASKPLYEQLESQTGFFDPNNLVTLSEEGLAQLNDTVQRVVMTQLQKDITAYERDFLSGEGNIDAASNYTERYADYRDTLAMGLVHDRFVVAGQDAGDVRDAVHGAIDDFSARFAASIDQTVALQSRIGTLADELSSRGMDALNYHESEITALPENAKIILREAIETKLEERLAAAPEDAPEIEAFRAMLDERIADTSPAEPAPAAAPAPVLDRAPGMD